MTEPGMRAVRALAEDLFGVGDLTRRGDVFCTSMSLDARSRDPDGGIAPGTLGVMIDSALGYAVLSAFTEGWVVTTEMTLDVYPSLQQVGDHLSVTASVTQGDSLGGFAAGEVRSATGQVVAMCTQRARFVPTTPAGLMPASSASVVRAPDRRRTLHPIKLIGVGDDSDSSVYVDVLPVLQNPLGNLHGGFSLYACDAAAARARAAHGAQELVTSSVHVAYLRPVAAGTTVEFRPRVVHAGRTFSVIDVDGLVDGVVGAVAARVIAHPLAARRPDHTQ